ncbi:MAG: hypothetical protein BGO76_01295 [Caedibacter sp. 38-128]|nr:hypothetical protein [Holosporales bacterium]OJX05457.1 MAG: hypothetical protein BGO76_01295 [Caedibacter sp. 38-128]
MKKTSLLFLTSVITIFSSLSSTWASQKQGSYKERDTGYCQGLKASRDLACSMQNRGSKSNVVSGVGELGCPKVQQMYFEQCMVKINQPPFPPSSPRKEK